MEKSMYNKRMSTGVSVLLIVSIFILIQCSAKAVEPNKSAVGLIRFSIDVFDNQKGLVEKERNRVEKRLKKFLKTNFNYRDEFYFEKVGDGITYSDIEDPDVTIDPQFGSRANKKLKELSEKNNLDAIVFGHFQEEDDLVLVFRYYVANGQIPKEQGIVSTKSIKLKIDGNIKSELPKQVDILAAELEQKLLNKFVKAQPEEKTDTQGNENKTGEESKQPPVKSDETPKANEPGVQTTPQKKTVPVDEMLTTHEVYKMIYEKGFYCETVDSDYHNEALKGIHVPGDGRFRNKRNFIPGVESNDKIRTESEMSSKGKGDEKIILNWPKKVKLGLCYYDDAKVQINVLNKAEDEKGRKWRIPTIMELFSIVIEGEKNYFHKKFKFPNRGEDLIFWTSTRVKKEGTMLEFSKNEIAYFVIRSKYIKEKDVYSLSFAAYNIEKKEDRKAFLLPVYSEKEYRYKPLIEQLEDSNILGLVNDQGAINTSAGSTTNPQSSTPPKSPPASTGSNNNVNTSAKSLVDDKIPGFDDVPESDISTMSKNGSKYSPSSTKPHYKGIEQVIKIGIIPFVYSGGGESDKEKKYLNSINDQIEKMLEDLGEEQKKYNIKLVVRKIDATTNDNRLTIFFNCFHGEALYFNKLEEDVMNPLDIHIVVTVKHFSVGGVKALMPIVIERIDKKKAYRKNFICERGTNLDDVIDYIKGKIMVLIERI